MASKFNLVYDGHPVMALPPAADAAGRSGQWISLREGHKAYAVVNINQGNAATVALTFQQATSAGGAGAKALSGNLNIWANQAQAQAAGGDTLTQQTSAQSFTTSSATGDKKIVFEIVPEEVLDTTDGFCYVQVITGASNSANITQADYFIMPNRYAQQTPVSAVV
jgi:hypothetical protein